MAEVLLDIKNALAMMTEQNIGAHAKEELSFIADQAISNIQAWKAHLLRSLDQDQARLDVIDELDESSVLLRLGNEVWLKPARLLRQTWPFLTRYCGHA